jgi:uncharacterized protein (DUF924 family)
MIQLSKIKAMGDVKPRHHRNVWDWVIDNIPITYREREFLTKIDDFVPIRNHRIPECSKLENRIKDYVQNHQKSWLAVSVCLSHMPRLLFSGLKRCLDTDILAELSQ